MTRHIYVKEVYYIVVWQNEETWIYKNKDKAIRQVEYLTGKKQSEWDWDNGDNDEDGRAVYLTEAVWGD